jgi:hypothetical protein
MPCLVHSANGVDRSSVVAHVCADNKALYSQHIEHASHVGLCRTFGV